MDRVSSCDSLDVETNTERGNDTVKKNGLSKKEKVLLKHIKRLEEALDKLRTVAQTIKWKTQIKRKDTDSDNSLDDDYEFLPARIRVSPAVAMFKEWLSDYPQDPRMDEEILATVDEAYYNQNEDFDASEYALKRLPNLLDSDMIELQKEKLKIQLQSMSRKFAETVLENYLGYRYELNLVMDIELKIKSASVVCHCARRCLAEAQKNLTFTPIDLLRMYRRRRQLLNLLSCLILLQTMHRNEQNVQALVQEEKYTEATQLCRKCQKAARSLRQYRSIRDMSHKLKETMDTIEDSLDFMSWMKYHNKALQGESSTRTRPSLRDRIGTMFFASAINPSACCVVMGTCLSQCVTKQS